MTDYNWPEITNDTPLSEIKEIHRRIWDYVIENGEKPDTPYINNCVLCEYSHIFGYPYNTHEPTCSVCPAKWDGLYCDGLHGGEYYLWRKELDPYEKRLLAMKIRDIEFFKES